MSRPPIRETPEEWFDYCIKHGTNGDQVFDIINDWKITRNKMLRKIENLEEGERLWQLSV